VALHCCVSGARPDRCTKAARELAQGFLKLKTALNNIPKTSLDELDKVETHLNQRKQLSAWLGIRVSEPERQKNGEILWHLRRSPSDKLPNIMTIGNYDGHEFLIKDIKKLARLCACVECQVRFTKACNLERHSKTCSQGKKVIDYPNKRVEAPQTAYERVFYGKPGASASSVRWLGHASKQLGRHIHHELCGHDGERWIEGAPVDGYDPKTKTVFQYHGYHWYGCRRCFPNAREEIITHSQTRENHFLAMVARTRALREAGIEL